jgi:hypothetical protein
MTASSPRGLPWLGPLPPGCLGAPPATAPTPGTAHAIRRASPFILRGPDAVVLNPGAEPWTAGGVVLKDTTGAEVELSAWQESAIAAGARGFVVMGAEREPGHLACPCTLNLWEAQGPRTVTIRNVTFPAVQQSPARE